MTYYLDFTNLDGMTEPLTNKDLAEGKRGDCALCPVALGVARMFDAGEETGCYVHVSLEAAVIHEHGEMWLWIYGSPNGFAIGFLPLITESR